MSNESIKKLLVNVQQSFTEAEKLQGRANLGAAAAEDVISDAVRYSEQNLNVAEQTQARDNIGAMSASEVNSVVQEAVDGLSKVASTGNYDDLVNKPSIPAAQVQSDWNQADSTKSDFIKNKPSIPAAQVQSDWNQADSSKPDFIKNKPSIPAAQVQSDWNQSDIAQPDFIKNKPEIPDLLFKVTYGSTTIDEITSAVNSGKIPILEVGNSRYALMTKYSSGKNAWFTTIGMEGSLASVGAQSYIVTTSGWATDPARMNGNKHFHLPNVQTAIRTIEVLDEVPVWMTIGELVLGATGSSSGVINIYAKAATTSDGGILGREFKYDTFFSTTSTSDTANNSVTFGTLSTSASWTKLYTISQYSGTSTVTCKLDISLFDVLNALTPSHYNLKFHKYFDGSNNRMLISATYSWGDAD